MHALLKKVTEVLKGYMSKQIESGANVVMVFDSWAAALEESAYGVSFFERLEAGSSLRSVTKGPDPSDVLESIKRNVSNLLNTRLGEAQSAPSLGLIDFNDATLGSNDLAVQIKFAIRHCLEKYEPRLNCMEISDTRRARRFPERM